MGGAGGKKAASCTYIGKNLTIKQRRTGHVGSLKVCIGWGEWGEMVSVTIGYNVTAGVENQTAVNNSDNDNNLFSFAECLVVVERFL